MLTSSRKSQEKKIIKKNKNGKVLLNWVPNGLFFFTETKLLLRLWELPRVEPLRHFRSVRGALPVWSVCTLAVGGGSGGYLSSLVQLSGGVAKVCGGVYVWGQVCVCVCVWLCASMAN